MNEDGQELTLSDAAVTDKATLLEPEDQRIEIQQTSDHPATKIELICFFLFGVFNNFSYIIMLR